MSTCCVSDTVCVEQSFTQLFIFFTFSKSLLIRCRARGEQKTRDAKFGIYTDWNSKVEAGEGGLNMFCWGREVVCPGKQSLVPSPLPLKADYTGATVPGRGVGVWVGGVDRGLGVRGGGVGWTAG